MNPMQRRAALDDAASLGDHAGGHAVARTRLVIDGMVYRAGTVVSPAVLAACKNYRALISTRMIELRPGPPPADAPQPVPQTVEDDKATREAIVGNMKAAGYSDYEVDASVKPTPGARIIPHHPSTAVRPRST